MQRLTKLLCLSLLLASSLLLALLPCGPVIAQRAVRFIDDDAIGRAFANKTSDIQVEGKGKVIRLLSDDSNGPRHQRFIVQLASRQTLLISHNTYIAPRIA